MARAKSAAPKTKTIGELIDALAVCEERRKTHAAEGKVLDAEKADLQKQIIDALDAQGTTIGESPVSHKRVSISKSEEPQITDWDKFMAWAIKSKNTHLIQRRIGAPAWREVRALTKKEVPGTEVFVKRNLSFTTVTK